MIKMPISLVELDSSTREEKITLILGKNILLKIIENPEKQSLLKNRMVQKVVSVQDLCHDDIRLPIENLVRSEDRVPFLGSERGLESGDTTPLIEIPALGSDASATMTNDKPLSEEIAKHMYLQKSYDISVGELQDTLAQVLYSVTGKTNKKLIGKEDEKLVSIGDKIREKTGFEVLVPSNLLLCPKCEIILSTKEFSGKKKCPICKKEVTRKDAERIYIHKMHDQVKKALRNNFWFEAYVARLLRKLEWKTWTAVHVMGASGILHEIDVLAIRDGIVLICECKTGKVSRNTVFNFCTKAGDLKAHVSLLALIGELPEPETREFVRKNPAVITIENMRKKKEDGILGELTEKLSTKG